MKIFLVILVFSIQAMAVQNSSVGESDGVSSVISAEKLKGLEDWLYNLKLDIQRDVTQLEKSEVGDKERILLAALNRAFKSAGVGTEEFLTRNILIRGIEVYNEILSKDMGSDVEPKRSAFARRFLELHLRWAGELAPLDKKLLENLKDPYKISESEQRVEIGMEWAQRMVTLSFSLPSNEAHYNFLLKTMGYLFNDIVNDDRYNRKLASTARVFVEKYEELKILNLKNPLDHLEAAKDFREFLINELNILSQNNVTQSPLNAIAPVEQTITNSAATIVSTKNSFPAQWTDHGCAATKPNGNTGVYVKDEYCYKHVQSYQWTDHGCAATKPNGNVGVYVKDEYCYKYVQSYQWTDHGCAATKPNGKAGVHVASDYCYKYAHAGNSSGHLAPLPRTGGGDVKGYVWYAGVCKMVSRSSGNFVKSVDDRNCQDDIKGYVWYAGVCKMVSRSSDNFVKSVNDSYCM